MCVPPRHDLPEWSCVNNETKAFNRKLVKIMKPFSLVSMVTVDTDRKFTRHGLHMNNLGKEIMASKVSVIVKDTLQKQDQKISLCWKTGYDTSANSVSDNLVEDNISLQVNPKTDQTALEDTKAPTATPSPDEGPRTSTRKKKPLTTKSGDFLW